MKKDLTIYHNPRCRKSREALAYLEEKNMSPKVVRYLDEPFSVETLTKLLSILGVSAKALVRTEEALWKSTFNHQDWDEKGFIKLMVEHPKLIQRPIVTSQNKGVVARPLENLISFLENH